MKTRPSSTPVDLPEAALEASRMKTPRLTEVFVVREADPKMPDWAKKDDQDRANRMDRMFKSKPTQNPSTSSPMASKPPTQMSNQTSGPKVKPELGQAQNKYLHVYQWAPQEASPNAIQKNKTTYDKLSPDLFKNGMAKVDSNANPEHGWGNFKIGQNGELSFNKDNWDSSG